MFEIVSNRTIYERRHIYENRIMKTKISEDSSKCSEGVYDIDSPSGCRQISAPKAQMHGILHQCNRKYKMCCILMYFYKNVTLFEIKSDNKSIVVL